MTVLYEMTGVDLWHLAEFFLEKYFRQKLFRNSKQMFCSITFSENLVFMR